MTDQQINMAIAEACGWPEIHDSGVWHHHKLWGYQYVLDYCNDLNAMHNAEKTIFPYYATLYANKLAKVTKADYSDDTEYFCATARQRAEAFLMALGKWKPTTEESSADHLRDGTKMMGGAK